MHMISKPFLKSIKTGIQVRDTWMPRSFRCPRVPKCQLQILSPIYDAGQNWAGDEETGNAMPPTYSLPHCCQLNTHQGLVMKLERAKCNKHGWWRGHEILELSLLVHKMEQLFCAFFFFFFALGGWSTTLIAASKTPFTFYKQRWIQLHLTCATCAGSDKR